MQMFITKEAFFTRRQVKDLSDAMKVFTQAAVNAWGKFVCAADLKIGGVDAIISVVLDERKIILWDKAGFQTADLYWSFPWAALTESHLIDFVSASVGVATGDISIVKE